MPILNASRGLMRFSIASLLILGLGLGGCAVNPVTGKSELSLISESDEISIGANQYSPSQQSQGGLFLAAPEVTQYVQSVGQRVADQSDRPLPYEFVVLNNSVPNAWALPGGKIAVNRGLLTELDNEAELAAVLGHEVVHAAAKHGANAMQRGMILQGLVMATAIAGSDSNYSNYIVGGAQLGAQLISQKYGRGAELEADYYGIQYMTKAGYDPHAAVTLQETFVELSGGHSSSWIDGLFASHPPSMDRVDANKNTITELGLSAGDLGESRYQNAMAFLFTNEEAYSRFDSALSLAQNDDYDGALGLLNSAIKDVPNEARFYGLKGNLLFQKGDYDGAEKAFNQALLHDSNYYEYYLGRGLTNVKQGRTSAARTDLERSNELLPTAIANTQLGELSLAAGDRAAAKNYFSVARSGQGNIANYAGTAYAKLDIEDNPGSYVNIASGITDSGDVVAQIANASGFGIRDIRIRFQLSVNGQNLERVVEVEGLRVGQSANVGAGWKVSASDQVGGVSAQVIGASAQ